MRLKGTVVAFGLLFLWFTQVSGQAFSKQWIYQQGQATLARKLKAAPAEWASGQPARRAPQNKLQFRSEDDNVSNTEEPESELHAAINPADTNNIIIAGMVLQPDGLLGSLSFPIYYTKDFGQSWQRSDFNGVSDLPPFTLILGGGDPVLAFDRQGKAYLSWLTFTASLDLSIGIQLHWAVSNDGGATWERQPSYIDNGIVQDLNSPNARFVDKEWLATDISSSPYRNNLYAAYVEINLADTTYNILVKTKAAEEGAFGAAVDVTPEEIVFSQFSSIDVDSEGKVHVLFAGATAQDVAIGLYHCFSEDGGASFSVPVRISSLHLPCFPPGAGGTCDLVGIDSARVYPCPHLRVDRSGGAYDGNLYAVWTADGFETELTPGVDIYFSSSKDGGLNWSPPEVLNKDGIPAAEQFFPSLAVNDEGTLAVSWYDRREDPNNLMTKYYMAYSEDGGQNFEEEIAVSSAGADFSMIGAANANFGIGEYTQIVATGSYAIPVWADGRTNDGNIDIYTAFIPLSEGVVSGLPIVSTVSDAFVLGQPTPNPSQGDCQISLSLQRPSGVQLQLFNHQGQLVWQRRAGDFPKGKHLLQLPALDQPAGQYLLRVATDFGMQTRKLQLSR